ncbi:MAG: MOSC domain-containing protein [Pseudomonadota bacterium]
MKREVTAICVGSAREFRDGETSAIGKQPLAGLVQIDIDGLVPDEQADRKVHGGPEMAIHLYPADHHAFWRERLDDHPLLSEPGAFGSNLSVSDLTEEDVHIGDRFRLGTALLEVSQPRQPCWKIEHRFGVKKMVATIIQTARCGWYFRVIQEGEAQAGDMLERVSIGARDWSVARTFTALIAGKGSREELRELSELKSLAPKLKAKARAKLG